MGSGSYSRSAFASYSNFSALLSRDQVFTQSQTREIHKDLNPLNIGIREARDSSDHPNSTAIIVGTDVTGSMGMIAENLAKVGIGKLMNNILESLPVTDPQIMFMGIGDAACDDAPLQVSQFESDNRMVDHLTKLWLEGCGGGNDSESYELPWHFAAYHTDIDCYNKRGQKGYLFTVGDECFPRGLTDSQIGRVYGGDEPTDERTSAKSLLHAAQEKYNVFHLIIEQGNYYSGYRADRALNSWRENMGKRAVLVDDYTNLPEIVVALIRVNEGENPETVLADATSTSLKQSIRHALFD